MEIIIRKAEKGDISALLELYSHLNIGNEETLDISSAEKIFNRIRQYPDYCIYIASMDNKVIGAFSLLIMDNLAHFGSKSGIVEDVVVLSEWQNHGIGKQMMDFAMQECRNAKCYKLALSSNLKREQAHKFYEWIGFRKHGYSFVIDL
jgi:GNAT superfamily N-acetyltransferase